MIDFSLLCIFCFTILITVVLKILKFQSDTRTTIGFSPAPPNKIVIVNTPEECVDVLKTLNSKCIKYNVLGFDCEWVTKDTNRRNPTALLQLASCDGFCVLIRLNKFTSYNIPMELKALLEDPLILKVGVVPSDDANYLMQDYNIVVRGCVDLRYIIERIGGNPQGGLSGLAERILSIKMDKSFIIRCSDWEAEELTEKQILYAANDALVAVDIFRVSASGFQTYFKYAIVQCFKYILIEFLLYSDEYFNKVPSFIYEYSDMNYHKKNQKSPKVCNNDDIQKYSIKQKPVKALKPASRAFCSRQSPLYHNCFMQAPDGAMLCTCDRKKAIWYVSKGLADLITEDPLTVRLKFEPSGRAVGTVGEYYIQTKSNCCVVCGKVDNCIRKNVVPHEYRKNFPKIMKDHVSHDILLLCLPCHLLSNSFDLQMKHRLADMCNAPFCQGENTKYMENRELCSVRAAAKALLRKTHNIPLDRQETLQGIVKKHYGTEELTEEILLEASAMKTNILNEEYDPHGVKVVQYFSVERNGGILKLEKMWREHFLITMKPRFMPRLWSVTHTEDRLAIRVAENRILPDELVVAGMKDCVPLLEEARKTRLVY